MGSPPSLKLSKVLAGLLILLFFIQIASAEEITLESVPISFGSWTNPFNVRYETANMYVYQGSNAILGSNYYKHHYYIIYRVLVKPDGSEEIIDKYDWNSGWATDFIISKPMIYFSDFGLPEKTINITYSGEYRVELRWVKIPNPTRDRYERIDLNSTIDVYDGVKKLIYSFEVWSFPFDSGEIQYQANISRCRFEYEYAHYSSGYNGYKYITKKYCWVDEKINESIKVTDLAEVIGILEFEVEGLPPFGASPSYTEVSEDVFNPLPGDSDSHSMPGSSGSPSPPGSGGSGGVNPIMPIVGAVALGGAYLISSRIKIKRNDFTIMNKNYKEELRRRESLRADYQRAAASSPWSYRNFVLGLNPEQIKRKIEKIIRGSSGDTHEGEATEETTSSTSNGTTLLMSSGAIEETHEEDNPYAKPTAEELRRINASKDLVFTYLKMYPSSKELRDLYNEKFAEEGNPNKNHLSWEEWNELSPEEKYSIPLEKQPLVTKDIWDRMNVLEQSLLVINPHTQLSDDIDNSVASFRRDAGKGLGDLGKQAEPIVDLVTIPASDLGFRNSDAKIFFPAGGVKNLAGKAAVKTGLLTKGENFLGGVWNWLKGVFGKEKIYGKVIRNGKEFIIKEGSGTKGLTHILKGHEKHFLDVGISKDKIPNIIRNIIKTGTQHVETVDSLGRPKIIFEKIIKGHPIRVVTNPKTGEIITAYPVG